MYRLNKKKGFTLIEVLCSITLFSVLFMIILTMELKVLKVEKYNKEINNYSPILEQIKNTMIYNSTYDEIEKLNLEHKYYMSEENIDFDKLREKGVINMFVETRPLKEPYLVINIEEGKVLKVNLKLYANIINNTRVMECEFYKGKYKK
jgi:prepilin-type N-terminal cleavage/methylation domain-containing protein